MSASSSILTKHGIGPRDGFELPRQPVQQWETTSMLTEFISANYAEACPSQHSYNLDLPVIEMMNGGRFNRRKTYNWLNNYSLFQGIKNDDRWKIVDAIPDLRSGLSPLKPGFVDDGLYDNFDLIFSTLYDAKPRLWLSAASKLLWCRFPAEAVIYDSFVERTLTVLQWLDDALLDQPRIGSPPKIKSTKQIPDVVEFYRRYNRQVRALEVKCESQLGKMRKAHGITYPYDIRILDQLLWMVGRNDQN